MAEYVNQKTGAIINTNTEISGVIGFQLQHTNLWIH